MISVLADPSLDALAGFDAVIDVRSPSEFAEDHVPGAINLPVLSDAERARVGTIYVQESRFLARRIGAAITARNIAHHLETALADRDGAFRPLVYCWRGGQRSGAMATVMDQIGWRVSVLQGGYRTYRRGVTEALYERPWPGRLILLDGPTGVAKTDILARVAAAGGQTLDLEGLASHRGSLFGALPGRPQPSQKAFESALLAALNGLDPTRPTLVEAESSKVGEINLPPGLFAAMRGAPRLVIEAPAAARAAYLLEAYGDAVADPARVDATLARLPPHHGKDLRAAWRDLAAAGRWAELVESLMAAHYDPGYARSGLRDARPVLARIALADLDEARREEAARQCLRWLEEPSP
ncbi:MAG: tRNA 2-selenouridine(34) synthase MnmH [Alphaproteobacteria bacterium]|nr:tRNA 2-selenouridine(34) synthase MnmH [Alphaproteobacteria bacterium]